MDFTDYSFLKEIRIKELLSVVPYFPKGCKLLEIGSGAGWQAKELSKLGFDVSAIDVESTNYWELMEYPVLFYDGKKIPFEDNVFDVVFSSNTLEHVSDISGLNKEIQRILKDDGIAVHILPSSAWRFWTLVTYFPDIFRNIFHIFKNILQKNIKIDVIHEDQPLLVPTKNKTVIKVYLKILKSVNIFFPGRHGERGNSITELYFFSRLYWKSEFKKAGFNILSLTTNDIFYTGHTLFARGLSLETRRRLASILGSACNTFVLNKNYAGRP